MKYSVFIGILAIFLSEISCSSTKSSQQFRIANDEYIAQYKADFIKDPRSPLIKDDLALLRFYPADVSWKLQCTCQKIEGTTPFELPTYSGITRTYRLHSTLECVRNSKEIRLNLYQNLSQPNNPIFANHLFLPFKDETNSVTTYGGGRYIDVKASDIIDGKITIDFNRAYNPWCAYSDGFNCPIPPKENHLNIEVKAGELDFTGEKKHRKLE